MSSTITSEILTLYEVSSTIGSSTDLFENCSLFVKTLVARKGLDFASIFIKSTELRSDSDNDNFISIYSTPKINLKFGEMNLNKDQINELIENKIIICEAKDTLAYNIFDEKYFTKGKVVVFSLGTLGFLIMHSVRPELNLTKIHIKQMENIIKILTTSIQGNLSMIRLNRRNQQLELLMQEQKSLIKSIQVINEDLEQFAYVASHDLREPLRGITRLSQWLLEDYNGKLDETGIKYLSLMKDRVLRMDDLIRGILDYSRVELNKQNIDFIDVNEIVENAIKLLDLPDNIVISKDISLETMFFEKTKLIQIFHNLLTNSIKHNDKEIVEIDISVKKEGGMILILIKDNGPGIAKIHQERVFQMFQTLNKKKGVGIGLSVVKKIVLFNKGSIQLNSEEGDGTSISIYLPLIRPEVDNK